MQQAEIDRRIQISTDRVAAKRQTSDIQKSLFWDQAREAVEYSISNKLRFCHVRKLERRGVNAKGGVTVCYSKPHNSSVITFSLTQCSPKDVYCRATGRIHAVDNWQNNCRVSLLLPKGCKPSHFLKNFLFGYL